MTVIRIKAPKTCHVDPKGSLVMYMDYRRLELQRDKLVEALEAAKAGLLWYQSEYPDQVNGCDDEAMQLIDAALEAAGGEA